MKFFCLLIVLTLAGCASMPSRNMLDMTPEQIRKELSKPI